MNTLSYWALQNWSGKLRFKLINVKYGVKDVSNILFRLRALEVIVVLQKIVDYIAIARITA